MHLDAPDKVVASAVDLLRPGGIFALSCPHDDEVPDPEHVLRWGHDEMFHLLAPHSDTVSFRHFPPPCQGHLLAHLVKNPQDHTFQSVTSERAKQISERRALNERLQRYKADGQRKNEIIEDLRERLARRTAEVEELQAQPSPTSGKHPAPAS